MSRDTTTIKRNWPGFFGSAPVWKLFRKNNPTVTTFTKPAPAVPEPLMQTTATAESPRRKPLAKEAAVEAEIVSFDMTKSCARDLTDRIKSAVSDVADMLHRAHEGRAWAALGYLSWKQYCETEFQMTKQRSYQLIAFTEIKNLIGESQPGLTPPLSEKQIRPLAKLEPEQQVAAWGNALEIAGGEHPTSKQVEQAVGNVSRNKTSPKLPSGLRDEIRETIAAALNRAWAELQVHPEMDWQLFCAGVRGWLQPK
jgi:hypothetical protein